MSHPVSLHSMRAPRPYPYPGAARHAPDRAACFAAGLIYGGYSAIGLSLDVVAWPTVVVGLVVMAIVIAARWRRG